MVKKTAADQPVDNVVAGVDIDPEAYYDVQVSKPVDYKGKTLSRARITTMKGSVLLELRDSVAHVTPAA